ncbi:MAG TPA: 4-hydroxy-tetrahydrodipicolinate reductase [Brumimicrobium sp.]|nr:4-hydroxy-tetrahydrodipicolinate reductase [Brumimicrobium sp.]
MKIVLVGYGKMGKEIEKLLPARGHQVVAKITSENPLSIENIKGADVAIDFSTPKTVLSNIDFLLQHNIPTIVGTTGWNDHLNEVTKWVEERNGALIHASNFSIGVNLFFKLNEQLAQLMNAHTDYQANVKEIHHTEKLDAPSGTAITLAEDLIENNSRLENWYCPQSNKNKAKISSLRIEAVRENDVKGTHIISYESDIDTISIRHEAHNRKGFALGSIIAAEWIQNKKGIFTMKDVLQLS